MVGSNRDGWRRRLGDWCRPVASYIGLLWFGSKQPELELDDPDAPVFELPETGPTVKSGFALPVGKVVVLIWCLMVEQMVAWSIGLLSHFVHDVCHRDTEAHHCLLSGPRGACRGDQQGGVDLVDGLAVGARNMIGVLAATAAAGIIVGTVSLTGVGLIMTEVVDQLLQKGNPDADVDPGGHQLDSGYGLYQPPPTILWCPH